MLRDTIRTADQLDQLVSAIRSTLTLRTCADILGEKITDPAIQSVFDRLIGKNELGQMKDRAARALAGRMLGFDNEHTLAAHYKSEAAQPLYIYTVTCSTKHGTGPARFASKHTNSDLGFIDYLGPAGIEFDPSNSDHEIHVFCRLPGTAYADTLHGDCEVIDDQVGYCRVSCNFTAEGGQPLWLHHVSSGITPLNEDGLTLSKLRSDMDSCGYWGDEPPFDDAGYSSIPRIKNESLAATMLRLFKEEFPDFNAGRAWFDADNSAVLVLSDDLEVIEYILFVSKL